MLNSHVVTNPDGACFEGSLLLYAQNGSADTYFPVPYSDNYDTPDLRVGPANRVIISLSRRCQFREQPSEA